MSKYKKIFVSDFDTARFTMYKEYYRKDKRELLKEAMELNESIEKFIKPIYLPGVYYFSSFTEAQIDAIKRIFKKQGKNLSNEYIKKIIRYL